MKQDRHNVYVPKRSASIEGWKTSISLEKEFWAEVKRIAKRRRMKIGELIGEIDWCNRDGFDRKRASLSSAVRVFVLNEAIIAAKEAAKAREAAVTSLKELQALFAAEGSNVGMKLAIAKQAGLIDA